VGEVLVVDVDYTLGGLEHITLDNAPYVKLPAKWQVLARKPVVAADSSGARY
jgi:hypothetical protein